MALGVFVEVENVVVHPGMSAALAGMIGAVVSAMLALDYPYTGGAALDPIVYEHVVDEGAQRGHLRFRRFEPKRAGHRAHSPQEVFTDPMMRRHFQELSDVTTAIDTRT